MKGNEASSSTWGTLRSKEVTFRSTQCNKIGAKPPRNGLSLTKNMDEIDVDLLSSESSEKKNEDVANKYQPRINKFQGGIYDKPIVLIGCSGAGDELNRLAAYGSADSTAQRVLEQLEENENTAEMNKSSDKKNTIIPSVGTDTRGSWVLSYPDLEGMIKNKIIDRSNVIVLDFDAPSFNLNGGENEKKLMAHLSSLAKSLYEQDDMLSIYINVHPEEGLMSKKGSERRASLEKEVFRKYSDYELCIKNEGLDVMTVMAQKLVQDQVEETESDQRKDTKESSVESLDELVKNKDPFDKMLSVDSEEKRELLDSIVDGQYSAWDGIEWQLRRILARAFLPPAIPGSKEPTHNNAHLTMGQNTFFLSLSFPDVMDAQPYVGPMLEDVDAMELRVDLLSCRDDHFEVLYSLQKVREMCRIHAGRAPMLPFLGKVIDDAIPVVYTVRTAHQAGVYPDDDEGITNMFDLLQMGLRSGVEILDVESAWDYGKVDLLLSKVEDRYTTQILGSHHVVGEQIPTEEAVGLFQKCSLNGRANAAKVVLSISDESMDHQALNASNIARLLAKKEGRPKIPHWSDSR